MMKRWMLAAIAVLALVYVTAPGLPVWSAGEQAEAADGAVCPCAGRMRPASERSTYAKSASQMATMFTPAFTSACMFDMPMPPIPTIATLSVSLGAW